MKVSLRTVLVRQKLLHAAKTTNLKVICRKFLERGHAYMEVDSMHIATEFAKKKHSCVFIRRMAEYLQSCLKTQALWCCSIGTHGLLDLKHMYVLSNNEAVISHLVSPLVVVSQTSVSMTNIWCNLIRSLIHARWLLMPCSLCKLLSYFVGIRWFPATDTEKHYITAAS